MKPIDRQNLLVTTCAALRDEIAMERWTGRLPGSRVLAAKLGVSATTVGKALDLLAQEGIIAREGERRAFRVKSEALRKPARKRGEDKPELLILTGHQAPHRVDNARQMVEMLLDQLARHGWVVRHQTIPYYHAKRLHEDWDRRIVVKAGTKVIAISGSPSLAEWAKRRKIPTLFYGGDAGDFRVPIISVSSSQMAGDALERLTQLGHERIILPLIDRPAAFKHALKNVHRSAIERAGGNYVEKYHNPESDYSAPDVLWRILSKQTKHKPPTALMLFDLDEMLAAHCFLAAHGLLVPRDVSLILLSSPVSADWFIPKLCRFQYPMKKIISLTLRWLEGTDSLHKGAVLSGDWVAGDSIGPCPANK